MSIVVRRGQAIAEPRPRLLRFDRPVIEGALSPAPPDESGSVSDVQDPRHELARLALDLVVRTAEPVELSPRWTTHPFGREVDRTRGQLAPIRSRAALLASFSREAAIAVTPGVVDAGQASGPVRVAYAIRWLELGDGRPRPDWASFVAGPVDLVSGAVARSAPGAMLARPDDQRNGEITT
jgi:hypothetical protein